MAISRAKLAKVLVPGLNALFGLEYDRYENEHSEIFDEESSDRAFEEEVMLGGFSTAPVKSEGGTISFDEAQETYTARYTHDTIALAFSITEEAIEDNLYDRLASRQGRPGKGMAMAGWGACCMQHGPQGAPPFTGELTDIGLPTYLESLNGHRLADPRQIK
jgi:hypothetical protein